MVAPPTDPPMLPPVSHLIFDRHVNVADMVALLSVFVGLFYWGGQIEKQIAINVDAIFYQRESIIALSADMKERSKNLRSDVNRLTDKVDAILARFPPPAHHTQ